MNYQKIFERAVFARAFEQKVFDLVKAGVIKIPVYLSAGQEWIPATLSTWCEEHQVFPAIFAQHRSHSTYLCFGGDPARLADELLGLSTGCAGGMGGSASIQCKERKMFGHDGLMGSQGPIATGYCHTHRDPTICILGDASAEEDYVMASIAWAGTKRLPMLFIVEDNNLSILTEKRVRRNWEMPAFAQAVNVKGYSISDSPHELYELLNSHSGAIFNTAPFLFNVNTTRYFWHAGAGKDGEQETQYDRQLQQDYIDCKFREMILHEQQERVEQIWRKRLEIVSRK